MRAGKTIDEMDIIEPDEAFMSPLIEFDRELGYEYDDPRTAGEGT